MKNLKVWLLLHINSSFDEKGTKKRQAPVENAAKSKNLYNNCCRELPIIRLER
jgi:hypothetical protein